MLILTNRDVTLLQSLLGQGRVRELQPMMKLGRRFDLALKSELRLVPLVIVHVGTAKELVGTCKKL